MSDPADPSAGAGHAAPAPLRRNRDFLLLWGGVGLTLLGARACVVAYPFLVLWKTGEARDAGLVGFAGLLPNLLVQLPAGALVDRWDRRRLMIVCDIGAVLVAGSVAAAVLADRIGLAHLVAAAFAESTLAVFYQLAERAAVRHVVPAEQLSAALGQNEARWRAAGLLGQPLGGLLYTAARWAPFLFSAVTHVLSLLALLPIRTRLQSEPDGPRAPLVAELREGLVWTWRRRFLRVLVSLIAGTNLLFQVISLALVLIVRENGGSATTLGLVTAVGGIGGTVGALTGMRVARRVPLRAVAAGGTALWAVLVPVLALTGSPVLLGAVMAAMAYVGGLTNVAGGVYQVTITPERMQGRVSSLIQLLAFGTGSFGALAGGYLLDGLGVTRTLGAIAAAMAVLALFAVVSPALRHPDRAPEADLPVGEPAAAGYMDAV